MNISEDYCSPYKRTSERERYRRIVLLKRYKPDGDAPRDFKSYDGRGASKALLLARTRAREALSRADIEGDSWDDLRHRYDTLTALWIERDDLERGLGEMMCESEAS